MYISNTEILQNELYICGKTIGKYLIEKGILLLSRNGDNMIFLKDDKLQKAIDKMPIYLKILKKAGVING